jgi:CubicO group peptidase (beta-lactamase class C family)
VISVATLLGGRSSRFVAALALGTAGCAPPAPLCPRPPDAGFTYPAGPVGGVFAGYVHAFDTGDPASMRAFGEQHASPQARRPAPAVVEERYVTMRDALGCLAPRAAARRGDEEVLLVETAREGYFELSFHLDEAGRIVRVRGLPAMPPGRGEPASVAAAVAEVEEVAADLAAHDRFSGVVVVADHGRPLLARAAGLADRAAGIANRLETRFNIGSVGKMFTGVAVAQLVESGKIRFAEPVGEILGDYPLPAARGITLHQLLTHTSGLGDIEGFLDARPPLRAPADFIARFGQVPLAFAPGRGHRYSNLGFAVLGRVVEVASGERFDEYLRAHVFAPAGMSDTGPPPRDPSLLARPYTRRARGGSSGERRDASAIVPPPMSFGCQPATAMDLVRFGEALFGGALLRPETVRVVTSVREAWDPSGSPDGPPDQGAGYGFGVSRFHGERVVSHEGGSFGVSTTLSFLPDAGLTVVVLTNDDPPAASRLSARALRLLAYAAAHAGTAASGSATDAPR